MIENNDAPRAPEGTGGDPPGRAPSRWKAALHKVGQNTTLKIGLIILGVLTLIAILAPILSPFGPGELSLDDKLAAPNARHPFGTDRLGVDVMSRTFHATRLDLGIALASVAIGATAGIPIGVLLGYFGGWFDTAFMRMLEAIQSFPPIVLAMSVVAAFGQDKVIIVIVIAFIAFPYYVRLVRSEAISKREWQFIEAAEAVGNSRLRVAFVHLLPNSITPGVVYASLNAGFAILVAATLGFLGLGIGPGEAEWGLMVREGSRGIINGQWWLTLFPGLFITLTVGAFYLVGDGLRDVLDPKTQVD